MLFTIFMHDRPDSNSIRVATAAAHQSWIKDNAHLMYVGGPFLADDDSIIGSIIIGEFTDRTTATEFINGEPYNRAGLFESVTIHRLDARIERGKPASPFIPNQVK